MIKLRRWHSYVGLFIAPSVLFFALTGVLQIFGLHESHGAYRAPTLIEELSAVHKDQEFEKPHEHHAQGESAAPSAAADEEEPVRPSTLALKWFFGLVSLGLTFSTGVGVWMGVTQLRNSARSWTLLALGTVIPVALLLI